MALAGGVVVLLLYIAAAFAEFVALYDADFYNPARSYQPPHRIHFVDTEGRFHVRPFVYAMEGERDIQTLALVFEENKEKAYPIRFLVRGQPFKLWGLIPSERHLLGLGDVDEDLFLLGGDRHGRDVFSLIVYGARISLSIGLAGVILSFIFGILIGGVSGFFGGIVDVFIQRIIEFVRSMPTIPLWMSLSAALPPDWPIVRVYFGITLILSLIGWTGLARVVRGRFLSLREEDFVLAARLGGSSELRIILRHMVPSFLSHIIASLTLAVPRMILSETALSFLGLGLRYPAISWGVMLQDAQNIRSVALAPWLLLPGLAVIIAVLSMNFLGDGLRDAADPYGR
jgi:peptide/nickel transport system permease protein